MNAGRIVRFDEAKGYGFIAAEDGGEDVFFHASLLDRAGSDVVVGSRVTYEAMEGDRGLKAFRVVFADDGPASVEVAPSVAKRIAEVRERREDDLCDVLTEAEYSQEVTDVLLEVAPDLTGGQIKKMRAHLLGFAHAHGWIED